MLRILIACASVLTAGAAAAQTLPSELADAAARHHIVYVLDGSGQEFSGRLLRVDGESLTIRTAAGDLPFALADLRTIDRRGDSLRNGAIIGAAFGALFGALGAASSDCGGLGEPSRRCNAGESLGIVAVSIGLYAAMGTGIDALRHGRTRVYPGRKRRATVRLEPVTRRSASELRVSVTW
jgi:hypothetical protein